MNLLQVEDLFELEEGEGEVLEGDAAIDGEDEGNGGRWRCGPLSLHYVLSSHI